jgi:hypothetical protein
MCKKNVVCGMGYRADKKEDEYVEMRNRKKDIQIDPTLQAG